MAKVTFNTFCAELERLVTDFQDGVRYYNGDDYDEQALRNDFLNPLWRALGWDLENLPRKSQLLRDVQLETRVDIAGRKKRADYIFRTDGIERFVCEAKRPKEGLSSVACYQAQRYAFNLGLYVGLLSDFQELKVFVVGGKPDANSPVEPVLVWHFSEYLLNAQQIWDFFAYETVAQGSLDKYVGGLEKKPIKDKARQGWLVRLPRERTVDSAFLAELEDDRVALARDLVRENAKFEWTDVSLNEVIQRILDRILFVRFCEDREIDTGKPLENIVATWRNIAKHRPPLYPRLVGHFRTLDDEFNGALFKRNHESEKVAVSDEFLAGFVEKLSSEDSPYLFNTLPVEVLGSIYERFIGRVVHVTKGGSVSVKEKPEVRKAGGVYYTPRYVVNYIVERTVGELVKGKPPNEVSRLAILDPACGSGSFLISAFERICEAYLRWYHAHPEKQQDEYCYMDAQGNLHLTTHLKRQVLLNNIFGVDIDPQAVEVTMLSLYLKALEGETQASVAAQQRLFPEEALLPDLSRNIRIGNSLVESDYSDLFRDVDEEDKIRPFDWDTQFADIHTKGGFDAVIGNPPYYNIDKLGKKSRSMQYLKRRYSDVWNDKTDILNYFLYRAVTLSQNKVGMIVSRAFLEAYKSNRLRDYLRKNVRVEGIVDFGDFRVFADAGIATAITIMQKASQPKGKFIVKKLRGVNPTISEVAGALTTGNDESVFESIKIDQAGLTGDSWNFSPEAIQAVYDKIDDNYPTIGDLFVIGQGMQTGRNEVFGGLTNADTNRLGLGKKWSRKRAANADIDRYVIRDRKEYLLWVEKAADFSKLPRLIRRYLSLHEAELKKRAAYKRGNCDWWKFTWPLHKSLYHQERIIAPFLSNRNRFALDRSRRFIGLTDTIVLFKKPGTIEQIEYFLGLLNSKLLDFRFKGIAKLKGGGIYEYFWNSVSKLRMRRIDFEKRAEKEKHDEIVKLVRRMGDLALHLRTAHSDAERGTIRNSIASTDRKIDTLVYELYRISQAEQRMIEEGSIPKQLSGRKRKIQIGAAKITQAVARQKVQKKNDLQPSLFS